MERHKILSTDGPTYTVINGQSLTVDGVDAVCEYPRTPLGVPTEYDIRGALYVKRPVGRHILNTLDNDNRPPFFDIEVTEWDITLVDVAILNHPEWDNRQWLFELAIGDVVLDGMEIETAFPEDMVDDTAAAVAERIDYAEIADRTAREVVREVTGDE